MLTWSGIGLAADNVLTSSPQLSPSPWRGRLATAVGRYVLPENPRTSLLLRGAVEHRFDARWSVLAEMAAERPFSEFEDWKLPGAAISLTHRWNPRWALGTTLAALSVDRWSVDGAIGRWHVYGHFSTRPTAWLTVHLRLGPVLYASSYKTRANGTELPTAGVTEKVSAVAEMGPLIFDAFAAFEQAALSGRWRNEYGIGERLAVRLTHGVLAGVAHELWTGLVDATTGFARPLRLADDRDSRVQAFLEWVF